MAIGLVGRKVGMTRIFTEDGVSIPVTVIEATPNRVTAVKTEEVDGYNALQVTAGTVKASRLNKPEAGHFAKAKTTGKSEVMEFRDFPTDGVEIGAVVDVNIFEVGDYVDVVGTSKGKGFQGVVKRHGFSGVGESTHGQHNRLRAPGSIGACSFPGRVFKGMRMAGRTGGERVKTTNLSILKIDSDRNLLVIKGSIPGHNGSTVIIEK